MCISDTNRKKEAEKTAFVYLLIALFCAFFGAVYEVFSHEVYSFYMLYAFAFPLVGGTLGFWLIARSSRIRYPGGISRNLYHSGIATLTVGSILRGVLDIYGTTNSLLEYYFKFGGTLILISACVFLFENEDDTRRGNS